MPKQNFITLEYLKGAKDGVARQCSSIPHTVAMDENKTRQYVDVLLWLTPAKVVRQRVQLDRIIRRKLSTSGGIPL